MDDAGVVAALDLELHLFPGAQVHTLLGQGDGWGGAEGDLKENRHPVGNAAVDAPGVIGLGDHLTVLYLKGIVGLGAPHIAQSHPGPEGDRLHRRDGEKVLGEDPLHVSAEVRGPQPRREAHHGALDGAAHAVTVVLCLQNSRAHLLSPAVVQHGEGLACQGAQGLHTVQCGVADPIDGADVAADPNLFLCQQLPGHRPCRHQRGGEPAGEVAAPPVVQVPLALDEPGVIPVTGPGGVAQRLIVGGVLVEILNDQAQRRPGGLALKKPGEDVNFVRLLPGGGQAVLPRGPAGQLARHSGHVQRQPGGNSLQHHADGAAVGFAENGIFHALSS